MKPIETTDGKTYTQQVVCEIRGVRDATNDLFREDDLMLKKTLMVRGPGG